MKMKDRLVDYTVMACLVVVAMAFVWGTVG